MALDDFCFRVKAKALLVFAQSRSQGRGDYPPGRGCQAAAPVTSLTITLRLQDESDSRRRSIFRVDPS